MQQTGCQGYQSHGRWKNMLGGFFFEPDALVAGKLPILGCPLLDGRQQAPV